jgi:16S rRNA (adenine1518-N6/adenine1519-N6)-dimethyltransferase
MSRTNDHKQFAKKSLGQNFLSDSNFIAKIVDALDVNPGDDVVEIGPGRGALTRALLEAGASVRAVELDRDLIASLVEEFGPTGRFMLIEGDALKIDFADLCHGRPSKLAANLPYYISTAILQRLIDERGRFERLVVMLQKEVVERITAPPGSSERGFLTVIIEAYFDVKSLFDVPPAAFSPSPKVWSAVAELRPKGTTPDAVRGGRLRRLVSAGFAQRRKTIANNLKASGLLGSAGEVEDVLSQAGIEASRRAETLSLTEWLALAEAYRESGSSLA